MKAVHMQLLLPQAIFCPAVSIAGVSCAAEREEICCGFPEVFLSWKGCKFSADLSVRAGGSAHHKE
jgi:hypothetical protein